MLRVRRYYTTGTNCSLRSHHCAPLRSSRLSFSLSPPFSTTPSPHFSLSTQVGIQSLFNKIGCNTSAMSEMLADSLVTEANMMQYLGMIEQRTNELLQGFAAAQKHQTEVALASGTGGPGGIMQSLHGLGDDGAGPMTAQQAMMNILGQGPMTPMGQELIQVRGLREKQRNKRESKIPRNWDPYCVRSMQCCEIATHWHKAFFTL